MRTFRTVLEQKLWERRQTLEEFAEYVETYAREHKEPGSLGVRHLQRLVSGRGPGGRPLGELRPATARLLERIFGLSADVLLAPPTAGRPPAQAVMNDRVAGLDTSLSWLDDRAELFPDTSRQRVDLQVRTSSPGELLDMQLRRAGVGRSELSRAVAAYYGRGLDAGHALYRPSAAGVEIDTTILSRPDWLDVACPLTPAGDMMTLVRQRPDGITDVDDGGVDLAVGRLAEAAVLDVRVSNAPLYRLLNIDVSRSLVSGMVDVVPFAEYALTLDLLENELTDAVLEGRSADMPLRNRYLPDVEAVLDFPGRLCAGGVLGLCAVARPADPAHGPADYALLVQERSANVLNAVRRLAVIPKGFHQPLKDVRGDARIGATLRREMEEELFGRVEVDSTAGESRVAAPMHPSRLSEPMRWLSDDPARMRMECTGFGVNLVSGNYEFASLIVIEDDEFWPQFGGAIEANWETSGLRVYSSLDRDLLSELIKDETWSNEGLFAFLQGIRRLREIGGSRVDLPAVELDS